MPTDSTRTLVERLSRLLPVSWDNELDGRGEPTHAVLTFGEHQTQAITMVPDDWMALNEVPDALTHQQKEIEALKGENARLRNAIERYKGVHGVLTEEDRLELRAAIETVKP